MNEISIAYITNPNKKTAEKIAREILKKRLAACTNIFRVDSIYVWKEKIVKEKEYVVIAKTTKARELQEYVESIHPYEIPCVLNLKAEANEKFFKWVKSVVR